jgi:hypothetical protein
MMQAKKTQVYDREEDVEDDRAGGAGQNRRRASEMLEDALRSPRFPEDWVRANIGALLSGDYSTLSGKFRRLEFIGPAGDFVLVAPYTVVREAKRDTRLSGVVGRVIDTPPLPPLEPVINELFGPSREPVPRVLPVEVFDSFGHLNSEAGDAFIVPDGFAWSPTGDGPAINNMTEQRRRLEGAGFECVRRVFDDASAELLLEPLLDRGRGVATQHLEYQLHDAGHASGTGLHWKLNNNLLPTFWSQGVEEWRADGVDFELAARTLTPEKAAQVVASNFVVRFGVDAHRGGGVDRDFDVVVTLLTLDRLFKSDALHIHRGRLAFADPTPRGLLHAVELHRAEALRLTRDEAALTHPSGVARLHGEFGVPYAVVEIFNGLVVEPCEGLFRTLR